jgi:hypothetical protein
MACPPIRNEGGGRAPAVNQRRLRRKVAASKAPTILVGEYFVVNDQLSLRISDPNSKAKASPEYAKQVAAATACAESKEATQGMLRFIACGRLSIH